MSLCPIIRIQSISSLQSLSNRAIQSYSAMSLTSRQRQREFYQTISTLCMLLNPLLVNTMAFSQRLVRVTQVYKLKRFQDQWQIHKAVYTIWRVIWVWIQHSARALETLKWTWLDSIINSIRLLQIQNIYLGREILLRTF